MNDYPIRRFGPHKDDLKEYVDSITRSLEETRKATEWLDAQFQVLAMNLKAIAAELAEFNRRERQAAFRAEGLRLIELAKKVKPLFTRTRTPYSGNYD